MFKGIGCLLLIFFVFFVALFKVLQNIYRALTGEDPTRRTNKHHEPYRSGETNGNANSRSKAKRKVIPDDVGEYVDYEDINKE